MSETKSQSDDDVFLCPECEEYEPEVRDIDTRGEVLVLLECGWCGYSWHVRADKSAFYQGTNGSDQ